MTTSIPNGFFAKIASASALATLALGLGSCTLHNTGDGATDFGVSSGTSPATQEFVNQNGFKPSDYFGAYGKNDYVPKKSPRRYAKEPESDRTDNFGRKYK